MTDESIPDEVNAIWHVYPTFGREHVTDGGECWCEPEPSDLDERIMVHHVEQ